MTNPAVDKKRAQAQLHNEYTTSTGYRVRLVPVGSSLITEVMTAIKDPPIPVWHNEQKGRDEENPTDPVYLQALTELRIRRNVVANDAMVMFGVELIDPLPEDDMWLRKLQFIAKRSGLDLSDFDFNDPFDREFLFKKYIVVGSNDIVAVGRMAGLSQEDVAEAAASFPDNAARVPD